MLASHIQATDNIVSQSAINVSGEEGGDKCDGTEWNGRKEDYLESVGVGCFECCACNCQDLRRDARNRIDCSSAAR